jgi:hypothetical protein
LEALAHVAGHGLDSVMGEYFGRASGRPALPPVWPPEDTREPLGRERLAPPEPTRRALTTYVGMGIPQALAFGRNPKATARGLRLVVDDVGWEHGEGPLVTAPSSALIRALTGRPVGAGESSGPGASQL